MNIEFIKQVICDSIPDNVNFNDVDIKECGSGLKITINWDVYKASEPIERLDSEKVLSLFNDGYCSSFQECDPQWFNSNLDLPKNRQTLGAWSQSFFIKNQAELYRSKLQSEIPMESDEFKASRDRVELENLLKKVGEPASLIRGDKEICNIYIKFDHAQRAWTTSPPDIKVYDKIVLKNSSKLDVNCYSVLNVENDKCVQRLELAKVVVTKNSVVISNSTTGTVPLEIFNTSITDVKIDSNIKLPSEYNISDICKSVIDDRPNEVKNYLNGLDGNFGYILGTSVKRITEKYPDEHIDVKRISECIKKILDEKKYSGNSFVNALIRGGIDSSKAHEIANIAEPKKVTIEGKIKEPIILKDSCHKHDQKISDLFGSKELDSDVHVPSPKTKEEVDKFSNKSSELFSGSYGYKIPEGQRTFKKAKEVVDDYKKACESYHKKFGILPTFGIRGKRGVTNFSTNKKDVTDVEIMLLSNDDFINKVFPESKAQEKDKTPVQKEVKKTPVQKEVKKTPVQKEVKKNQMVKPTKLKRIWNYLKAIKEEILNG